ncbi:inorganic diphosphatase [Mesonia sp. MT50]|uniref:inorganic diphosphatase n=1 Tax=Mesonia profundi TaxID=3070998 RepID=A0ABU0ZZH5_9FLAO|nr:inorganic diphosphatase [Mesonia profundi]MDQ7916044.1 inorganic diphosphatase [Mesonia profundi]
MKYLSLFFILVAFIGCEESPKQFAKDPIDYYHLPTFVNDTLQAVIEIPAGTNKKIKYNREQKEFITDSINGQPKSINFLPYIGNYGFIPSTYSNIKNTEEAEALNILVLAESQPSGSLIKVIPIGVLRLSDNGLLKNKIIAVPALKEFQIFPVKDFDSLSIHYPEIRKIISLWFQNYNTKEKLSVLGFYGEDTAMSIIKKSSKN